jgi:hypothetical protein
MGPAPRPVLFLGWPVRVGGPQTRGRASPAQRRSALLAGPRGLANGMAGCQQDRRRKPRRPTPLTPGQPPSRPPRPLADPRPRLPRAHDHPRLHRRPHGQVAQRDHGHGGGAARPSVSRILPLHLRPRRAARPTPWQAPSWTKLRHPPIVNPPRPPRPATAFPPPRSPPTTTTTWTTGCCPPTWTRSSPRKRVRGEGPGAGARVWVWGWVSFGALGTDPNQSLPAAFLRRRRHTHTNPRPAPPLRLVVQAGLHHQRAQHQLRGGAPLARRGPPPRLGRALHHDRLRLLRRRPQGVGLGGGGGRRGGAPHGPHPVLRATPDAVCCAALCCAAPCLAWWVSRPGRQEPAPPTLLLHPSPPPPKGDSRGGVPQRRGELAQRRRQVHRDAQRLRWGPLTPCLQPPPDA